MEERRSSPRIDVSQTGVVSAEGWSTPCTVRNISSHGAAIEVTASHDVPKTFKLLISGESTVRLCRVVWVSKNRLGLAFE